ncbi:MAG: hypothetical protein ABIS29_10815 [Vicinamibacterales bacterium]
MLDPPTGRLKKLSNKPKVKANNHAQSTLDLLRGALYYALSPLLNRTVLLVKSEVRLDGKWKGIHFNSAPSDWRRSITAQ